MKFICLNDIPSEIKFDGGFFRDIQMLSDKTRDITDSLIGYDEQKILDVLNSINNQNIQSIDMYAGRYKHRDTVLSFNKLSSAEKVFLIALAADVGKKEVYIYRDIKSLTKTTMRQFIRLFHDSPYVNAVYELPNHQYYYEALWKEALNNKEN